MVDIVASVANGIPWLSHEVSDTGQVALILGEGGFDAGLRLNAWMSGHPRCTDDRIFYSIEEGLDLMDEQQVDQIIEDLLVFADDWKLIIFDTQADHMPNGDEDTAKDFTAIKKALQRIAHATGAAVGVHHRRAEQSGQPVLTLSRPLDQRESPMVRDIDQNYIGKSSDQAAFHDH